MGKSEGRTLRFHACVGHEQRGLQNVRHPRDRNQIVIASLILAVKLIFAASPVVNDVMAMRGYLPNCAAQRMSGKENSD